MKCCFLGVADLGGDEKRWGGNFFSAVSVNFASTSHALNIFFFY